MKWIAVEHAERSAASSSCAGGPPAGAEPITADDSVPILDSVAATFHALFAAPGTIVKLELARRRRAAPAIEFTFDETPLIQSLLARLAQFPQRFR